jgi:excisionase family DNA binding protein
LSVDGGARYLGITADQVRAFIADGELRYIDLGRGKKRPRIRLTKENLDEFIEQRTRRDMPPRLSTDRKSHRSTGTTSKSVVSDFMV